MDTWNETENFYNVTPPIINGTWFFEPKRDSLYIVIPMTIIYVIIFFTGIIGNVSTCIVISRNKSMHTATNYYLFSLAISDLLLLLTGLPQEMYSIWSRYPYVFGEIFCVLRGLAAETSTNATVLTITAFTVERYIAICHPFLTHTMSKLSRAIKLILIIWLVAFSFALPQALQFGLVYTDTVKCTFKHEIIQHSFELSTFLFFVAPMTLITVLYALIGVRLRTSNMMKRNFRNTHRNSSRRCRHQHGQSSKRVLKMLVAVVVAFFICWAPFHAQRLVAIYGKSFKVEPPLDRKLYEVITYTSGILYYVSTTVNPVLYHIMSNKFREAFKETFSRWCGGAGTRVGKWERSGGSGRLSDRRSCYSVLSRSGITRPSGGRSAVARESTDSGHSGTSFTHRHSEDSICLPTPSANQIKHNILSVNDARQKESENMDKNHISEPYQLDINQIEALNTLTSHPRKNSQKDMHTKAARVLQIFHCITHRKYDKRLQCNPSSISGNCRDNSVNDVQFHKCFYEVSNSSLRDVDSAALEDELTIYMKEIHKREKTNAK